jgi:hypothetical protein
VTPISLHELVRKDLLQREREERRVYGAPQVSYEGSAAVLDAYDSALDLVLYLRQIIEEMTAGGQYRRPSDAEPPEYAG